MTLYCCKNNYAYLGDCHLFEKVETRSQADAWLEKQSRYYDCVVLTEAEYNARRKRDPGPSDADPL